MENLTTTHHSARFIKWLCNCRLLVALLMISWLLIGCTTTDGDVLSFEAGSGGLVVNSSIEGARVFVDYQDSGLLTPAVLSDVRAGRHVVHVFLADHEAAPDSLVVEVTDGEQATLEFQLNNTPSVGDLTLESDPQGALIYIDGLPFGRTPLTIAGLPAGERQVRLVRGNHSTHEAQIMIETNELVTVATTLTPRRSIMIEHFSNTDCAPCPEADREIEELLETLGPQHAVGISYHPNFPGPQDPFYLASMEDTQTQIQLYTPAVIPTAIVDGLEQIVGAANLGSNLEAAIERRAGVEILATIDIHDFHETLMPTDVIFGNVLVEAAVDLSVFTIVQVALIERVVEFDIAPGSNGQQRFTDVLRAFYPSAAGRTLGLIAGQSRYFNFEFERQPEWGDDLQVVAYLQNRDSKEIYQATWTVDR